MKSRKILVLASTLIVPVAALAALTPAYSWSHVGGSCSDGASDANFGTYYTLASRYNRVDQFEYILDNPNGLGNKNNVQIRHYRNIARKPDVQKYSWRSGDNVRANRLLKHTPSSLVRTPDGAWAHSRFDFVFDNSGTDDRCHADTSNFR